MGQQKINGGKTKIVKMLMFKTNYLAIKQNIKSQKVNKNMKVKLIL